MHSYKTMAAVAMSLALAACGGGGGGSDDAPASPQGATGDFTASTYRSETDRALEPLLLAFAFEDTLGAVRPFAAKGSSPGSKAGQPELKVGLLERRLLQALLDRGRVQALATDYLGSVACSGGGWLDLSVTYDDEDEFTPGDRVDVTSDGCIDDGRLVGGRLRLVLEDYDEAASSIRLEARLVADRFGNDALLLDGSARMTLQTDAEGSAGFVAVRYQGMSVTVGDRRLVWEHGYRYVFTETSETFALDGYASVDGRYYALRQEQPFSMNDSGVLTSGRASLLDRDGDRVQVDASNGSSGYTFFAVGGSAPVGPVAGLPLGN